MCRQKSSEIGPRDPYRPAKPVDREQPQVDPAPNGPGRDVEAFRDFTDGEELHRLAPTRTAIVIQGVHIGLHHATSKVAKNTATNLFHQRSQFARTAWSFMVMD
jgi:hypothetical protein